MLEKEYKGHTIAVYREEDYYDNKPNMPHEFFAEVDGERIMSATRIEKQGIGFEDVPNWTKALELYARAYIDGNHRGAL